ncbi:MAG: 2-hydroxychromene-2-carboxylate isomerase [Beijerinckiaceae bacterium]|nr:2-hydroxychromene-2-carboxylate isomerase [Beijerinckiaceae bacterium]
MRIVHYFSPMSGYSYLGIGALCELADRRRASVVHKPIDVMRLFAAVDAVPPAKQSQARMKWRQADMMRWAARRGLPLNVKPKHWPIDATLASCAIIVAQEDGSKLAEAVLAAVWSRDLDISRADVIEALARDCGLDPDRTLAMAQAPETLAIYRANTDEAIALGVVGAPTFVVGEDMFFGQDRLDFVDEALVEAMAA